MPAMKQQMRVINRSIEDLASKASESTHSYRFGIDVACWQATSIGEVQDATKELLRKGEEDVVPKMVADNEQLQGPFLNDCHGMTALVLGS